MNTEIHGLAVLPTLETMVANLQVCVQTCATLKLTLLLLFSTRTCLVPIEHSFMTQLPVVYRIEAGITLSFTPYANYEKYSEEKSKSLHTAHV